jgi:hydroxymethylglutaryl-CoA reductase|nr:hydroxymethylglutaryl-CoA reductase [uncultured bacterium]|tara:strand:- start:8731 stop:10068 length:1338 start_codon:yes stop_codon:yes gene_type:complete
MMQGGKKISGFSKLSKTEKIQWLAQNFLYSNPIEVVKDFASFWHDNIEDQKVFEGFSENTVSNFHMPFGIAPNFLINGNDYAIPMVTEESSVVAACANAAKFWYEKGGFKSVVLNSVKLGHVHFTYKGDTDKLKTFFPDLKSKLISGVKDITQNMENRGGGISNIELLDLSQKEEYLFQLKCSFETVDSMGANFINSCLEAFAEILVEEIQLSPLFSLKEKDVNVIMSILSNFTPDCVVRAEVSCPIDQLGYFNDGAMKPEEFAEKFATAVRIAEIDPYRATTHNKGIMNGIDSVVIATGNDFRAVEACAHTYAAKDGQYKSLTHCSIENNIFRFYIEVPLALGTVGGLTGLHPLAKKSMELMGNPKAHELMKIVAVVGLAQNFAALKSLTTTGIQAGHMKMHLNNILSHFHATEGEMEVALVHFKDRVVSFSAVREYLQLLRTV